MFWKGEGGRIHVVNLLDMATKGKEGPFLFLIVLIKMIGEENETKLTTNNAIIQLSRVDFRFNKHWREVARHLQIKQDKKDEYWTKHNSDAASALEECVDDWLRNSREPAMWDKFLHIIAKVDKSAARNIRKSVGLPPGRSRYV